MSGLRFTPGPWRADCEIVQTFGGERRHEWAIYSEAPIRRARCVAKVISERETAENARLIAAAPELYEAWCEWLSAQLVLTDVARDDAYTDRARARGRQAAAIELAKAALAKVAGSRTDAIDL